MFHNTLIAGTTISTIHNHTNNDIIRNKQDKDTKDSRATIGSSHCKGIHKEMEITITNGLRTDLENRDIEVVEIKHPREDQYYVLVDPRKATETKEPISAEIVNIST